MLGRIGIIGGILLFGVFAGAVGFMAGGMGVEGAKVRIAVRQEIPFSQVVSPYPDWLPIAMGVFVGLLSVVMFSYAFAPFYKRSK